MASFRSHRCRLMRTRDRPRPREKLADSPPPPPVWPSPLVALAFDFCKIKYCRPPLSQVTFMAHVAPCCSKHHWTQTRIDTSTRKFSLGYIRASSSQLVVSFTSLSSLVIDQLRLHILSPAADRWFAIPSLKLVPSSPFHCPEPQTIDARERASKRNYLAFLFGTGMTAMIELEDGLL